MQYGANVKVAPIPVATVSQQPVASVIQGIPVSQPQVQYVQQLSHIQNAQQMQHPQAVQPMMQQQQNVQHAQQPVVTQQQQGTPVHGNKGAVNISKTSQEKKNARVGYCIGCWFSFILLVVGIPLVVIAFDNQRALDRFPAKKIFEARTCEVISSSVRSASETRCCKRNNGRCERECHTCTDYFTYTFTQTSPQSDEFPLREWLSAEWSKTRDDDQTCQRTNRPLSTPHFSPYSSATCWWFKAVSGLINENGCLKYSDEGTGACLAGFPECGNDKCFVLHDPVELAADQASKNDGMKIGGGVSIALGFISSVCTILCIGCCKKR